MGEIRIERLSTGEQVLIFPCPECRTEYAFSLDNFPQTTACPGCGDERTFEVRPEASA